MDAFTKCKCKDLGPGGHRCPCCNSMFGKRKAQLNRHARHRLKQEDEKQFKINKGNNL